MNIVLFTHPAFLNSQSMPRFAEMIFRGMVDRGHKVEIWTARPRCFKLAPVEAAKKWLGYIDQFVLFPVEVKAKLRSMPADTLYVFADQALGPWVPLVKDLPHVIHCHDFLAQFSAMGEVAFNPVSFTGRLYQKYIRNGYTSGRNFISVSRKTREDLNYFLPSSPAINEVVYNGLNNLFLVNEVAEARKLVGKKVGRSLSAGYILHVGGNQWYKNRRGVIEIYNEWRHLLTPGIPLLLVGEPPVGDVSEAVSSSPFKDDIIVLTDVKDEWISRVYSGAALFLFPSIAEGFGWPIAEAMASGTIVVTTGEEPMTEVGGESAFYLTRRPSEADRVKAWASEAAGTVEKALSMSPEERLRVISSSLENSKRFDTSDALNKIEEIYKTVLTGQPVAQCL